MNNRRAHADVLSAVCTLSAVCAVNSAMLLSGNQIGAVFSRIFALSTQSLALARIGLGLTVLVDVVFSRARHARALYSDEGMCHRRLVLCGMCPKAQAHDICLYLSIGSAMAVRVAFMLVAVSAAAVTLGIWTKPCLVLLWLHASSIAHRCSVAEQAGDTMLRLMLFWIFMLPCDEVMSLRNMLSEEPLRGRTVTSVATAGFLVQLSLIYQFTAMFKDTKKWNDGTAIFYVLRNFAFAREVPAKVMLGLPFDATRPLTWITPRLERSVPAFVFLPQLRALGSLIFVLFHSGLATFMRLGIFPAVCICAWVAAVPSSVWAGPASSNHARITLPSYKEIGLIAVQLVAMALAICSNLDTLPIFQPQGIMTPSLQALARVFGQHQQWFLFDRPSTKSFWFRVVGETTTGKRIDLHRFYFDHTDGKSANHQEDDYIFSPIDHPSDRHWKHLYGDNRWRKVFQRLTDRRGRFQAFQQPFAEHLARLWDEAGWSRCTTVKLYGCWEEIEEQLSPDAKWKPNRKLALLMKIPHHQG
eukprot:g2109.t1